MLRIIWELELIQRHNSNWLRMSADEREKRTTPANSHLCARIINSAAVLRKFTSSQVTPVRKCIQADGGHFEQFARVLNGESVTVHLTT